MCNPIDMTSADWLQLNDKERYEAIEPICARFIREFGQLPKVNYIGHSPFGIHVHTALSVGMRIDSIPPTYCGVPVEQTALREAMDSFLATWTMILDRIGGWPAERIADYANDQHACFRSAFFLHDSPIGIVAARLLPEDLKAPLLFSIRQICIAIDVGFTIPGHHWHPDLDPNYDWTAARNRVHAVIESLMSQQ
jgi:hypothetical protein